MSKTSFQLSNKCYFPQQSVLQFIIIYIFIIYIIYFHIIVYLLYIYYINYLLHIIIYLLYIYYINYLLHIIIHLLYIYYLLYIITYILLYKLFITYYYIYILLFSQLFAPDVPLIDQTSHVNRNPLFAKVTTKERCFKNFFTSYFLLERNFARV